MVSKANTSTSLLLLGLTTSIANPFSTASVKEYGLYEDTFGIESFYSTPIIEKSRVENYVETSYKIEFSNPERYSNIDAVFFHIVQDFAENQVELEKEFYSVMDDLLISKINNSPSKKRF